jgi:hypothetical protein
MLIIVKKEKLWKTGRKFLVNLISVLELLLRRMLVKEILDD